MRAGSLRSKASVSVCLLIFLSIFVYSAQIPAAHSWGGTTHQFITQKTDNIMPSSLSWFFTGYSSTIVSYCTKPDQWKSSDPNEGDRHFYDYDVPHGENQPSHGVLPWVVEDNFSTFVQYLKENDWTHAAQLAGVIAHYIEDASMPLHATSYYNPDNHGTFESKVNSEVNIDNVNDNVLGFVPHKLDNIFNSTMQLLSESYGFAGTYTTTSPDNLNYWLTRGIWWNDNIKRITENRLRTATEYLANIWYTGMLQAGLVISAEISIVPGENHAENGQTVTFTVTVKNTGGNTDNYDVTVIDDDNWGPTLDNNSFENVLFGENRTTTLRVAIPYNAPSGTYDNITVTATSRADNTVRDNASCIARAVIENAFTLDFVVGWNLVGFTAVGINDTPNNLFPDLTYLTDYRIIYWQAPGGPYKTQPEGSVLLDNTGYWVWINQDKTVTTSGTRPASENVYLENGWNLVCFPVTDNTTTPNNLFPDLTYLENYRIIYWQAPGGPYKTQPEGSVLLDNTGYWVWIDRYYAITVP